MPKVSVIIPVYNVEEYLAECLESVINQTEKNIEIICVDDCSTDSSLAILQEYAKKDSRIIVIHNEVNSGQSVARNKGLAIAQGEFVLFVDSDDFIKPNLLETTLKYANNVDMVCFDFKVYNPMKLTSFTHERFLDNGLYTNERYFIESEKKKTFLVVPFSKLYKRDFLLQNNLKFMPGMIYEDNLFFLQCVLKAKKIYSINDKLYIYRIRPGSTMTKKLQPKNVNDRFRLLCEATRVYLENDVSEKFSLAIEKFIEMLTTSYARVNRQYIIENVDDSICKGFTGTYWNKLQRIYSSKIIGLDSEIHFSAEQLEFIKNAKNVVVYGAGDIARKVIYYLDLNDVAITGVAVSNVENNQKSLLCNHVRALSYYENIKDDCLVIIAVTSKFSDEIEENLKEHGFNNYIKLF